MWGVAGATGAGGGGTLLLRRAGAGGGVGGMASAWWWRFGMWAAMAEAWQRRDFIVVGQLTCTASVHIATPGAWCLLRPRLARRGASSVGMLGRGRVAGGCPWRDGAFV